MLSSGHGGACEASSRTTGHGRMQYGSDLHREGGTSGSKVGSQQESQHVLEQKNRRLNEEIRTRTLDMERLQREAVSLREQIQEEQRRRQSRVSDLQEQLQRLEGQNKQLQAQLSQAQLQNTSKVSDATALKREVVAKTMELEKLAREFQQSQSDLFSRVHSVSDRMLQMSREVQDAPDQRGHSQEFASPLAAISAGAHGHTGHVASASLGVEVQAVPTSQASPASQFASLAIDDDTLQALKRRLQSLGDVLVFTSDKFDACCASGHSIPPGAVRVRPRRCDHVFLVECLMPYWVEGLCPVCRCSFAYSRENDESDRCSSVSTSVSQRANVLSFRQGAEAPRYGEMSDKGETLRDMAPLSGQFVSRGPKVLRVRQDRPRSTSNGARSDASGGMAGFGDRDGRDVRDVRDRLRSPSRSGTGATGVSGSLSRTSSGRDRPL